MSNISGDGGSFSSGDTGEEVHQENKQQQLPNHPLGLNSGPSGAFNSNSSTNQQQQQANKKKRNLPGTPVQSDWKAHQKTCGTREYKCDCGTIFSRRDSFIIHRAFCDALTEENNRVNQQVLMPQNMQNEMPDLMSTMPSSKNIVSEFNKLNIDPANKKPLKTFPQELVPMPSFKSTGNSGGMFSTSSGTLFGGPRNMSPSSASSILQLSSNNFSAGFNYFQDNNNKDIISGSSLGHMSALALLQKAAQMDAIASNNSINSSMMQKSFVTSMAGPDHQQHHNNPASSFDPHFIDHQLHLAGVSGAGAFTNQFFQKGNQEQEVSLPLIFDSNDSTTTSSMGMFSSMFMGSDPAGLVKNVEQEVGTTSGLHDFLGIGVNESQKHQQ